MRNGPYLPAYGIMEFEEAEFGPDGFFNRHGYTVGAPANTSVCSDIAKGEDPRYVGPAGADAWHNYYSASSTTVPLANTGGCGTGDSHWREIYLQDELMTGYAQGGGEPLSRVTIGALQDLGYQVDFDAADDWSIPLLPTLRQVSPNTKECRVEFDFTTPFSLSLLGEASGVITPVDLGLDNLAVTSSGCDAAGQIGPQALPKIVWHLAEQLLPVQGTIDFDGNVQRLND